MRPSHICLASLLLLLSAESVRAFDSETQEKDGNKIKTCDSDRCTTMPNPKDLQGLQIRQTLSPVRQLLLYSPRNTFSCTVRQGQWVLSVRVVGKALPVTRSLEPTADVIKLECSNEQEKRLNSFYVPPVEYVPAIVR